MTKLVKSLVVDGTTLPMPSDYKFELQKVYVEEPSRNNSGAIAVFPDKFFVPYFTVTWNVIRFDDYSTLMTLIQTDENVVEYYDPTDQTYKTAKFYVQQPTYNKLYTMEQHYNFVTNLQLVFAGTMNDVGNLTIEYNVNGGSGTISSQQGLSGDEFVVNSGSTISKTNYVLDSWNTKIDGTGDKYELGSVAVMTQNLILYAQWVAKDSYTIGLSYGYASGNYTIETESISAKYNVAISGLPTDVPVCNSGTNDEIIDPSGNEVYTFIGWNKLSQSVGEGTYFANGDLYPYEHDTTLYAQFSIREYTLNYYLDEVDVGNTSKIYSTTTAEFKATISSPMPTRDGYTFDGWYYLASDDSGTQQETKFISTTMPYRNLNLYAKWSAV